MKTFLAIHLWFEWGSCDNGYDGCGSEWVIEGAVIRV